MKIKTEKQCLSSARHAKQERLHIVVYASPRETLFYISE